METIKWAVNHMPKTEDANLRSWHFPRWKKPARSTKVFRNTVSHHS